MSKTYSLSVFKFEEATTIRTVTIAAPGNKLAEITDHARKSKLSRSELMANATLHYIRANA